MEDIEVVVTTKILKEHNKNVIKKLGKELAVYFLPEDF
jgi:hypothetical protein